MKKTLLILVASGLFLIIGISNCALAATTFTQKVTIQVAVINELSVSGNPSPLIINLANVGSQPTNVMNAATTYNISSNDSSKKVTGMLNSAMPAYTSLKINLAAPNGATSMGDVTLSTIASNLVTGISNVAESRKTITYTFSANVAAGVVATGSRTVVLTITN